MTTTRRVIKLRNSRARRLPRSGLDALADAVSAMPEGNRNAHLYWATMRAVEEDHDSSDIEQRLANAAINSGLETRETYSTIRSGLRRAEIEGKRGALNHRLKTVAAAPSFQEWMDDPRNDEARDFIRDARARAGLTGDPTPAFQIDWRHSTGQGATDTVHEPSGAGASPFINVASYIADVPNEVPWLVAPVCYFGGLTLLAGIWKGGKSTLIAQLLRARETGEPFLGATIPVGPAVLITEEGGVALRRKIGTLKHLDILDRRRAVQLGLSLDGLLAQVRRYCLERDHPALVVIDTFAIWGEIEDENNASEITRALNELTVLAQETGAAVILVDHVRKEGGTHGRAIRGSGAKAATVDIFAELNYVDKGTKTDRLLRLEGRVIEPIDLRLTFDSYARAYELVDPAKAALAEIEDWLLDVPQSGDGATAAELATLWDMPLRRVRKHAEWLCNLGRMRVRQERIPGNNAKRNVYWAIPAAYVSDDHVALGEFGAD